MYSASERKEKGGSLESFPLECRALCQKMNFNASCIVRGLFENTSVGSSNSGLKLLVDDGLLVTTPGVRNERTAPLVYPIEFT